MDAENLSKRLAAVAAQVPKGSRLADIGSDHAYLPAHLLMTGQIDFAVAGEVVVGPYENMLKEVAHRGLSDHLIPRLANGLDAIKLDDKIDTVVIAGMGGTLITKILDAGQDKLVNVKRLILQPNVGEEGLRKWLANQHFEIVHEEILEEDDHVYEIIVATPTSNPVAYNHREALFGPLLIQKGGAIFKQKWQKELARDQYAIEQMQGAKSVPVKRLSDYQARVKLIEEVLENDNRN